MIRKRLARLAAASAILAGGVAVASSPSHADPPTSYTCVQVDPATGWGVRDPDGVACYVGYVGAPVQPVTPVPRRGCSVSVGEFQLDGFDRDECRVSVYMFSGRRGGRSVAQRCATLGGALGTGRFHGTTWKVCRLP